MKNIYKTYVKRLMDIFFSIVALIIFSPVLIAVSIVLFFTNDKHAVVFRQLRKGKGGKLFVLYKFKSLTCDVGNGYIKTEEYNANSTAFGRFLRKHSIDELLQLFNVLKGDMSLIGPRPMPESAERDFVAKVPGYEERYSVEAGMAGLSQVEFGHNMRGITIEYVSRDIYYARNVSFVLDMKIILKTIVHVIKGQNR